MTTVADRPATPAQRRRHGPAPDPALAWELVQRARAGDEEAVADIYRRYRDTVYFFVYYRLQRSGMSDRALAEDLTADTFVKALGSLGRFTFQGLDLGAWLVTIARNLVADHFKSARSRLTAPVDMTLFHDGELELRLATTEPIPDDEAERVDLAHAVRRGLRQLLPGQQRVLELRFLHGLSTAEAAEQLGIAEGAVKALQYRASISLRRLCPELEAYL